ncbi:MAG TPA: hypothetical protein EYQ42_01265 [Thiotrichaceae bacterium]|jgi:hypothetical protein|nr:hypothetical protein [Thiotrichaceae bacterium]
MQLDSLESELEQKLIPILELAAEGKNDFVFCVTGYHSISEFKNKSNSETEDLVSIGAQILSLKNKLGESSEGTLAERICWYCRVWGDLDNAHRKNAQDLAKQLLNEVRNGNT